MNAIGLGLLGAIGGALVGIGVLKGELSGLGGLDVSTSETGFAARFGGGVDIYFSEHFAAVLDLTYVLGTGDVDQLDYVSFGWGLMLQF